jgi:hypothetical protein
MPKRNGDIEEWRVSNAEFFGFVKAKLESMEGSMKEMKDTALSCRADLLTKIEKNEGDIIDMKIKSATFGGVAGFVGGFVGSIFKGFL